MPCQVSLYLAEGTVHLILNVPLELVKDSMAYAQQNGERLYLIRSSCCDNLIRRKYPFRGHTAY
jgi:hypothetical protein